MASWPCCGGCRPAAALTHDALGDHNDKGGHRQHLTHVGQHGARRGHSVQVGVLTVLRVLQAEARVHGKQQVEQADEQAHAAHCRGEGKGVV